MTLDSSLSTPDSADYDPWARLKEWRVSGTGSNRQLQVEFQGLVTGNVQILLRLLPRQPLEAGFELLPEMWLAK